MTRPLEFGKFDYYKIEVSLNAFKQRHSAHSATALKNLQQAAIQNGNLFAELMETVKHCSLGQITTALYEVGGQYRRSM